MTQPELGRSAHQPPPVDTSSILPQPGGLARSNPGTTEPGGRILPPPIGVPSVPARHIRPHPLPVESPQPVVVAANVPQEPDHPEPAMSGQIIPQKTEPLPPPSLPQQRTIEGTVRGPSYPYDGDMPPNPTNTEIGEAPPIAQVRHFSETLEPGQRRHVSVADPESPVTGINVGINGKRSFTFPGDGGTTIVLATDALDVTLERQRATDDPDGAHAEALLARIHGANTQGVTYVDAFADSAVIEAGRRLGWATVENPDYPVTSPDFPEDRTIHAIYRFTEHPGSITVHTIPSDDPPPNKPDQTTTGDVQATPDQPPRLPDDGEPVPEEIPTGIAAMTAPYGEVRKAFENFQVPRGTDGFLERGGHVVQRTPRRQTEDSSPDYHVERSFTPEQSRYVGATIAGLNTLAQGRIIAGENPPPMPALSERIETHFRSMPPEEAHFSAAVTQAVLDLYSEFGNTYPNLTPALDALSRVAGIQGTAVAVRTTYSLLARTMRPQEDVHRHRARITNPDRFTGIHPGVNEIPDEYEVWCSGTAFAKTIIREATEAARNLAADPGIASEYNSEHDTSILAGSDPSTLEARIAKVVAQNQKIETAERLNVD